MSEAQLLEERGASMLDFTNSGPVAGPAVTAAVSIPVLGGLGGGPWLDGRVRAIGNAIGYTAAALDDDDGAICERRADRRSMRSPRTRPTSAAGRPIKGSKIGSTWRPHSSTASGRATRSFGSGPPVLMFSPGGFDATVEKWTTQGIYAQIRPIEHCRSTSRASPSIAARAASRADASSTVSWAHYVAQGKGLLDHLHISRAHIMGACMGCSPAIAFAVAHPAATSSLLLYWPVGGPHYRISSHAAFCGHSRYVRQQGLEGVVSLVQAEGKPFNQDPRGGPWAVGHQARRCVRRAHIANQDVRRYLSLVARCATSCSIATRRPAPSRRICCASTSPR